MCSSTCDIDPGVYTFLLEARSDGIQVFQSFTLTVDSSPTFTSYPEAFFYDGQSNQSTQILATGSPVPTISEMISEFTVPRQTGLPGQVNFAGGVGSATLSCTGNPCSAPPGTYTFTLIAKNGISPPAATTFTLVVYGAVTFTSPEATTFVNGSANQTYQITASGAPPLAITESTCCDETGLPTNGVTFTDNGNGTATLACADSCSATPGTYTFEVSASDGNLPNETVEAVFSLTVVPSAQQTFQCLTQKVQWWGVQLIANEQCTQALLSWWNGILSILGPAASDATVLTESINILTAASPSVGSLVTVIASIAVGDFVDTMDAIKTLDQGNGVTVDFSWLSFVVNPAVQVTTYINLQAEAAGRSTGGSMWADFMYVQAN